MYSINNKIVSNYSSNHSLNELLEAIDDYILSLAITEYNNIRLGLQYLVDVDKYEDLVSYKKILTKKLLGCNCLESQDLIFIISKIKNLIH